MYTTYRVGVELPGFDLMSDSSVIEVTSIIRLHVSALLLAMSLRQFTDTITDPCFTQARTYLAHARAVDTRPFLSEWEGPGYEARG